MEVPENLLDFFSDYKIWGWIVLKIIFICISAVILVRLVRFSLDRFINQSSLLIRSDPTKFRFLKHAASLVIFTFATISIIYTIPSLHDLAISLFAGAGIFAAFLGFASQQAFSNIVSGIFIVIFQPFRVGDFIKIGDDVLGTVEDITLRHTVINNLENRRIIMPNSSISTQTITNSSITDEKCCRFMEFNISFESDVDLAMQIMQEEANKHPDLLDNRTDEEKEKQENPVRVRVTELLETGVRIRAWVWTKDSPTAFVIKCDLNYAIKKRFDEAGIEIPYPHRTLVYKDHNKKPANGQGQQIA